MGIEGNLQNGIERDLQISIGDLEMGIEGDLQISIEWDL